MKRRTWLAAAALIAAGAAAAAPDAQRILAASDAVRNPGRPFAVNVALTEFQDGKRADSSTMVTYSRTLSQDAQFATLVRFTAPARDTGKLMLKNGQDLWFYDPSTKASVRLSPQQRLLGQASNGDVVTVNLARDYKATLKGEEDVQDGDRKTRRAWQLELAAAVPDATYARIEFWVATDNDQPIKGRFFAESGRLLKTVYYRRYARELGTERPTELVIIDGLNPASVTLMRLTGYTEKNLPESWFQRDYLPRFQPE
ncbi:outer membrane lipoprotein-sorting protein [Rubrivivax gelatinosus]|uniref:Outer membrane lipoprotein-sorting protein n=1 Tax=Rubrivivax gelatinosus TaxID=28068 RepID=A0ABS1DWE6_RUBGE|nr:outer membrane lipoprotein-sorting protein [Rubrivivax gelatinosus]MBK1612246.1 outer membrane lipoprotein-sorting protein [Rubrivivax gelatinosus]MBK1714312.1 outer membrane lipoprotein-sorting protein [Rubrivivax gelatinosus]